MTQETSAQKQTYTLHVDVDEMHADDVPSLEAFAPDTDSLSLIVPPQNVTPKSPTSPSSFLPYSPHLARGKRTASLASMLSALSDPESHSPSSPSRTSLTAQPGARPLSLSFQNALQLRELSRQSVSSAHASAHSLIPFLPKLPHHTETRDNLVVPAYTRLYDAHGPDNVTRSWLYSVSSTSLYTPLPHQNPDTQPYITPNELGFDSKQLERAMPVPQSSAFLASSIKLQHPEHSPVATTSTSNAPSTSATSPLTNYSSDLFPASETAENTTKILHPETVGQLLRAYMIDTIYSDDDLVKYLRNFTATEDEETIAQHQTKAQSIFVKFLNSAPTSKDAAPGTLSKKSLDSSAAHKRNVDRLNASLTQKELTFLKLNHRDDLCLGQFPSLQLSTYVLTFSTSKENPCNIGSTITADFALKNKKKAPASCFVQPATLNTPLYTVKVEPAKIDLKKNQSAKITVSFTLKDYVPKVNDFITLEIVGGARHFIALSVFCQPKPQFGVPAEDTEMDYLEGFGDMPKVLIHLFRLYSSLHGRRRVGIFRRAGHETRMKQFKLQLNRGEYPVTDDYNSIANLIKIWFRELPVKLLDHFDAETLIRIDAEDPEVCAQLLEEIPEPYRRLFRWLLALMADIAENADENKMDPKNLAIVFSPNLYSSTVDNPAKIIMITQKLSQIVCSLIKWFMEHEIYPPMSAPMGDDDEIIVDAEYLPPMKQEEKLDVEPDEEHSPPEKLQGDITGLESLVVDDLEYADSEEGDEGVQENNETPPPTPPSDDDEPPLAPDHSPPRHSVTSLSVGDEDAPHFEEDVYVDSNDEDGDDSQSDDVLGESPDIEDDALASSDDTTYEELSEDDERAT